MPSTDARPLDRYPAEWVANLKSALDCQGKWIRITEDFPERSRITTHNKLHGMNKGLQKYLCGIPELRKASLEGRIRFKKQDCVTGTGMFFTVCVVPVGPRPSEIAAAALERFKQSGKTTMG